MTFTRVGDARAVTAACRTNALLHHARLKFRFLAKRNDIFLSTQRLLSLLSLPNATGLDLTGTSGCRIPPYDELVAALRSSIIQDKLIELHLPPDMPCDADMLLALAQLPHLRHLHAEEIDLHDLPSASVHVSPLPTTNLETWDYATRGRTVVTILAEHSPNLRHIILSQRLEGTYMRRWKDASMRHITSITVEHGRVHGSKDELDAAMANMHALEYLTLSKVAYIERLLPSLVHCPRLGRLSIRCDYDESFRSQRPNVSTLSSLLKRRPSLHLLLQLSSLSRIRCETALRSSSTKGASRSRAR